MERKAPRRRAFFLQNPAEMDGAGTRWPPPAPPDHHQDGNPGEVYKPEGQSLFALLRNSPPRLHVPFSVSQSAFLTQVTGKLGVGGGSFETGSKKRNGQKGEVEK